MSAARRRRTRWRRALPLCVLALGVGVVVALLAAFQRQLIYLPDRSAPPPAERVLPGARDVTLHTSDGLELGAWFLPAALGGTTSPAAEGRAVLLAPGNGGNRLHRAGLARTLSESGFAVLLLEYRGYGGNPGSPSEDGLARDADAAVAALADLGYPPGRTIYLGESLGTAVVAALAVRHPPAGLLLRSPFPELADVGRHHYPWLPVRLLLRDRFDTVTPVSRTDVPVTVVRGDRDRVIPSEMSAEVARAAPALVEELVLSGADHNDPVMSGPELADAVVRLAAASGR